MYTVQILIKNCIFLGGGVFCATDTFSVYSPSITMPGFGSLVEEVGFLMVILIVFRLDYVFANTNPGGGSERVF